MWVVLITLALDFILQNVLLALYIFYFLEDPFVNKQSKFVFCILLLIYLCFTLLINFVLILSKRWSLQVESDETPSKLLLAVFSLC